MRHLLSDARRSLEDGDFAAALAVLEGLTSDGAGPAAPRARAEVLEPLATARYATGDLEGAVAAWEELYALQVGSGDRIAGAQAAVMVAMYLMMDTGLMSPVRGWLAKADDLLEGSDSTPVHALLAMVRMYERFMCGDMEAAGTWSARAVELGIAHDVLPAETLGRVCRARVSIYQGGDITSALAALDEVAAVLLSGRVDPLTTGMVWCELICAVQGTGHLDRAAQWTDTMERWRHGVAFGGIHGRCRVHRAELLRLRGTCEEAEAEALTALEELRPWMRREFGWPLTELGTIRLRRGDLDGAEHAFREAHQAVWDPHPGLAMVRLARGDVEGARSLIAEALAHPLAIPSKERPPNVALRRAPLLEAQVAIAVEAADHETAARAVAELDEIAARYPSPGNAAAAGLARARLALATGRPELAVEEAGQAVVAWADIGAPFETASARVVLARALRASGNPARADLEEAAAASTFERIGAPAWAPVSDPEARPSTGPGAAGPEATGMFRLEGDTRTISYGGRTVLLRDLKGMRHLARMLCEPGREFHAIDLAALDAGADPRLVDRSDAGPAIDRRARDAYRRRLAECEAEIEEARRSGDPERAELAMADREYLARELARDTGLGGRPRPAASTSERARFSVTRAIRYAIERIAEHHPELGNHLRDAVRTGTYCSYEPGPGETIRWTG